MRLYHVDPARAPLRHAAMSPPQLSDSLHRLTTEQPYRPPDILSGHFREDGNCEHRRNYAQEVDPVCGICGEHGGHETAELCDVGLMGSAAA